MFNRTRRMTVSLSFIALFFLLTILVLHQPHWFQRMDRLFWNLPQMRTALGDQIMLGIASTATILPITGLFLLLGIYLWKKQQRVWAIWGIGNLIVVSGIGQVMKWLIQRPRPVLEAGMVRDSYSFPSGHTLLAVTLVTTCLLFTRFLFKKKGLLAILGGSFILLVVFSRFYLGVHYPSDTLASICLASGITLMTYEWTERILTSKSNNLSDKFKQRRRP
ncbi:phosphatase PAP2 family protein [Enterococcus gallinarum]|uniref:phosphatase PAP2 family protein n=1 Tax=Enterococcus gallinarum TaxID=1353 RepID=UPI000F4FC8B5|nr:phosphatase PAP2 family protein [Enterococcus gallinarum]ROZ06090.1 phosphatase PAP2 family protein [Enterococcus gallinarum]ROZ12449.1 phosphatase PAP2 family protein [Enterococcus gallinarum]